MTKQATYRLAVCWQDRETFAPTSRVWTEETVRAESAAEAIDACLRSHADSPLTRRAVAVAVLGFSTCPSLE